MSYVTPWMEEIEEGIYEVEMPSNVPVGEDTWNFTHWEDGVTNPVRTANLIGVDVSLLAHFELVIPPPTKGYLQVHAFVDSVEVVADGVLVETGQYFQTPITIEVDPGIYTVDLTYEAVTERYTADVAEGSTIRVDGQLAPPTPPTPPTIPILPIVVIGAVLLSGWGKKK